MKINYLNKEITKIIFKCVAVNSFKYKNNFTVIMQPAQSTPDYSEIERWLQNSLNNTPLPPEGCLNSLYEYLSSNYNPYKLKIIDKVNLTENADSKENINNIILIKDSEEIKRLRMEKQYYNAYYNEEASN